MNQTLKTASEYLREGIGRWTRGLTQALRKAEERPNTQLLLNDGFFILLNDGFFILLNDDFLSRSETRIRRERNEIM